MSVRNAGDRATDIETDERSAPRVSPDSLAAYALEQSPPKGAEPGPTPGASDPDADVRRDGTGTSEQEIGAETSQAEPGWRGVVVPFSVGDPGRAASRVVPRPARPHQDRPDTVLDGVTVAGPGGDDRVDLRAASTRGLKHRFAGTVRQDAYAFRVTGDGRHLVVAVADGVSASTRSEQGADHVTRQGCAEIARRLDGAGPTDLDWRGVARHLDAGLAACVRNVAAPQSRDEVPAGLAARDQEDVDPDTRDEVLGLFAATAVFAVVTLDGPRDEMPVVMWTVGDVSAWVLRGGTRWEPQARVKNADAVIASSDTGAFPIPPESAPAPSSALLGPSDVLVLMSDGIGDSLWDGTGSVGRFLAESWARPPERLAFAGQVDFARKSQDDDRTAVAVWPRGAP